MKNKPYFGPVQEDAALCLLRTSQHEQAHHELVIATAILSELVRQNERRYADSVRAVRTRRMTDILLGGPDGFGLLQEELEHRTGVLSLLQEDLPDLRPIDLLIFSYATTGMAHDLMAFLCQVERTDYINCVLYRLRLDIERLATPRKHEYLALLGPKGCHFGEEIVYLPDM